jgi:Archaeal holliday junction resolvase (hjc).
MDRNRKGDFAEFYAVTWLWDNGYEVFLNAGCTGAVDMIAMKDGETILVDVKTAVYNPERGRSTQRRVRTEEQKKLGVVFLTFNPDTRQLRWVEHKE